MAKLNRLIECINHPNGKLRTSGTAALRAEAAGRADFDENGVLVFRSVAKLETLRYDALSTENGIHEWRGRMSGGFNVMQIVTPQFDFGSVESVLQAMHAAE